MISSSVEKLGVWKIKTQRNNLGKTLEDNGNEEQTQISQNSISFDFFKNLKQYKDRSFWNLYTFENLFLKSENSEFLL